MRPAKKPKSIFSQRLMALRQARALTQEQLAAALGVSKDMIGYYEAKATNPTAQFIQKVSAYFDVPSDRLLSANGDLKKRPGPISKLDRLFETIRQLPVDKQKAIVTVLDMALQHTGASTELPTMR